MSMKKSNQGWEITTASSKLAECQETIVNLGKQLKALASSSETALLDKVVSTNSYMVNPSQKKNLIKKRSSLRTHMLAEDDAKEEIHTSVQNEESKSIEDAQRPSLLQPETETALQTPLVMDNAPEIPMTSEKNDRSKATGYLSIVPRKKHSGFEFLRRLLSRQKKSKGTKLLGIA